MHSFVLSRARQDEYPGVFEDIKQVIGCEAAALLVSQFGGCSPLYIPAKLNPEHPLCQLLGEEAAQQLSNEFAGPSVEIPRNVALQIEQRNRLIMADREAGMTQNELARKYQMTTRNIRNILNCNNFIRS